jgi:two-component system, OmpR family, osmolarity sensor histidine kinase EnvZ
MTRTRHSLQSRIVWLFSLTIFAVTICTVLLVRSLPTQNSAQEAAQWVYLALTQADVLGESTRLDPKILIRQDQPVQSNNSPAMLGNIAVNLRALVAQSDSPHRIVVLSRTRSNGGPSFQLWLQRKSAPNQWLGLAINTERERFLSLALLWLVLLILAVLIAARSLAKYINQPLAQITEQAQALIAGQSTAMQWQQAPAEIGALARALESAADAQSKLAHERELMLIGISHDLRTPIARLRMALELEDDKDPSERKAMLDDLEQMQAIIAKVLADARGNTDADSAELDLVKRIEQQLSRRHHPWRLELRGFAQRKLSLTLPWVSFNRVLGNLLDNAEVHGSAPFAVLIEAHQSMITIDVINAGNIDPQRVSALVLSGPANANFGLALAARIAKQFGAELEFPESPIGSVTVRLRIQPLTTRGEAC